ncbi:Coagulation factor VIII [Exaiptasia diaphana]|nr:Coagulation factor VIII [Exaiptasia diaphana]
MEDKTIQNSWITASSYKVSYQPHQARLHLTANTQGAGAWCASRSSIGQYLLIDLGKLKQVTGIATQGKIGIFTADAWVESYTVRYSIYRYHSWYQVYQTFPGNWDGSSSHYNSMNYPITARYIMIEPLKWTQEICMRVELYGCNGR